MKKRTSIFAIIIAVLALGIGYAAITAVTLTINGSGQINADQDSFNVHYTGNIDVTKSKQTITTTESHDSAQTGQFSVSGMTQQGDTVTFTYNVINESVGLKATLGTPTVKTNTNSEYFSVSSSTASNQLAAEGGTTTQTVTVTAIKTPIDANQTGTFEIELVANPDNS